VKKTQGP